MSIDDVDDVSSNDAVFRTVVDLTDAFLDRTEDGDRRDEENRDERERQKSILLFVCYRKMWACCAQKKVKVEFVTTGKTLCFCDVDTKSKKKRRTRYY